MSEALCGAIHPIWQIPCLKVSGHTGPPLSEGYHRAERPMTNPNFSGKSVHLWKDDSDFSFKISGHGSVESASSL